MRTATKIYSAHRARCVPCKDGFMCQLGKRLHMVAVDALRARVERETSR